MRKFLAFVMILCMVCSLIPASYATGKDSGLTQEEYDVLKIANQERAKEGLEPLTSVPKLQEATDIRAAELVAVTDHIRPDGSDWATVFEEVHLHHTWAGENVAAGQRSPAAVMNAWMNSDGHRANILREQFVHMGVGYHYDRSSMYQTHWVQLFYSNYNCEYTSMTVDFFGDHTVEPGTAPEDLEWIACLQCTSCGSSYLPVLPEYCSGYDPDATGKQQVTVNVLGQSATITVEISGDGEETEPTEPTEEPTEKPTEPEAPSTGKIPFADVKESDYFAVPVMWAVENKITNGTSANLFSPNKDCTRGQVVTFLWRAEGSPEPQSTNNPFSDVKERDYFYKAVLWAVEKGITTGTGKGKFSPDATCTRGQVATFLWRAQGQPMPTGQNDSFSDVEANQYYYNAVLWAVEKGITTGTGKGKFSPDSTCTRGQIVTFLSRAKA